jgi:hypothetical protein
MQLRVPLTALTAIAAGPALIHPVTAETPPPMSSEIAITRGAYHGWADVIFLRNGIVEAVIVPAVGRIMQLRFSGEPDGPFWENAALLGQKLDPAAPDWVNFGGDKAWPSPQDEWARIAHRPWPPPIGFDGLPMEAVRDGSAVMLVSAVDPNYGIRVRRRIELAADRAVMTITTRFEKTAGPPMEVGVWTITQVRDPAVIYAVLADPRRSNAGFVRMSKELPANLKVARDLVALTRALQQSRKIGVRAATLFWIGQSESLRIDSALAPGAHYPDQESSAEIYTNADPLAYVELEILGPIEKLAAGDHIERQSTYTLAHRTEIDPALEVEKLLNR